MWPWSSVERQTREARWRDSRALKHTSWYWLGFCQAASSPDPSGVYGIRGVWDMASFKSPLVLFPQGQPGESGSAGVPGLKGEQASRVFLWLWIETCFPATVAWFSSGVSPFVSPPDLMARLSLFLGLRVRQGRRAMTSSNLDERIVSLLLLRIFNCLLAANTYSPSSSYRRRVSLWSGHQHRRHFWEAY